MQIFYLGVCVAGLKFVMYTSIRPIPTNLKRSSRYCCYEVFIPKSSPPTGLPIMNYTMTNPYETQRVALSFRMQSGVVLAVGRPSRRG